MDELKTALHCMKVLAEIEVCEECSEYGNCDHTKQSDIARTCILALEKQIQKKPDVETTKAGNLSVKCPNCKQELFKCGYFGGKYNWNEAQKRHKYCENCGQAIDWNTED